MTGHRTPKKATHRPRLFVPEVLLSATPQQHAIARELTLRAERPGPSDAPSPEYELLELARQEEAALLQDALPLVAAVFSYRGAATPLTEEQRTAVLQEVLMLRRACHVVGLDLAIRQLGPAHEESERMLVELQANAPSEAPIPDLSDLAPRPVFDAQGKVVTDA